MNFSKAMASLVIGGLGAFGLVSGGCGESKEPPPSETKCSVPAACQTADPDCYALTDNTGQTEFGLRMTQIIVNKPEKLAPSTVVGQTVANGVTPNMPECLMDGLGTFSWLLHFNTMTNQVCTGGAKPSADPKGVGYTFVNEMFDAGNGQMFDIKPIKFAADLSANKFEVAMGQDIIVPIYADTGTVLLPLKKARIIGGVLSEDHNCSGANNIANMDPYANCKFDPESNPPVYPFTNGGKIEGYITLEQADSVIVDVVKSSLCVLLGGTDDGGMPKKCKRDAMNVIEFKGDWCDATNAAADATCADAVALGADFAASAVKIAGGCPIP